MRLLLLAVSPFKVKTNLRERRASSSKNTAASPKIAGGSLAIFHKEVSFEIDSLVVEPEHGIVKTVGGRDLP